MTEKNYPIRKFPTYVSGWKKGGVGIEYIFARATLRVPLHVRYNPAVLIAEQGISEQDPGFIPLLYVDRHFDWVAFTF